MIKNTITPKPNTKPRYKKNFTQEDKEQYKQKKETEKKQFIDLYKQFTTKKTIQEITQIITNYKELHNYSIRNRIFLAMQAHERGIEKFVGICNGFKNWQKLNIQILKGSSAYKVYAPMSKKYTLEKEGETAEETTEEEKVMRFFGLVNVFDISQTTEYETYLKEQKVIEEKIFLFLNIIVLITLF